MGTVNPHPTKTAYVNFKALKVVSVVFKILAVFPFRIAVALLAGAGFIANNLYTVAKKWPRVDAVVTQNQSDF